VQAGWSADTAAKKEGGLHPCEELDPVTNAPCVRKFSTAAGLAKHSERVAAGHVIKLHHRRGSGRDVIELKEQHMSLVGYSARDIFIRQATLPGASLAACARPNRSAASAAPVFAPMDGPTLYGHQATAKRSQYNKWSRKAPYRKTIAQLADLEAMWQEGENGAKHVTPEVACARMAARLDDQGRKFYSNRVDPNPDPDGEPIPNPNGVLLGVDTVKQWFSIRTANNRKKGNVTAEAKDAVGHMKKDQVLEALAAEAGSAEAAWALVEARSASSFKATKLATLTDALRVMRAPASAAE
jgi:hypothetical protein